MGKYTEDARELLALVGGKENVAAQEVNMPACVSCYLGVTEPAIFGVNLKYYFPFLCGMTGSACAAVLFVSMGTTANAVGLSLSNGMEILLHVGLDTVAMQGDGFEYLVEKDAFVKRGDPLIRFDRAKIAAAGYRDVTMCIITAPGEAQNIAYHTGMDAKAGETVVITTE